MGHMISRRAAEDLYLLFEQSKQQFGARAAKAYQDQFRRAVLFAEAHPLAAALRETAEGPVRVRYFGSHLFAYDIVADDIVVQRVLHQSQDWLDEL